MPELQSEDAGNVEPDAVHGAGLELPGTADEPTSASIEAVFDADLGTARNEDEPAEAESPGRQPVPVGEARRNQTMRGLGQRPAAYQPPTEVRIGGAGRAARLAAARAANAEPPRPPGASAEPPRPPADPARLVDQPTTTPAQNPPAPVRTPLEWAALLGLLREPAAPIATPAPAPSHSLPSGIDTRTEPLDSGAEAPGAPASHDVETRMLHPVHADGSAASPTAHPLEVQSRVENSPAPPIAAFGEPTTPRQTESHPSPRAQRRPELTAAPRQQHQLEAESELSSAPRARQSAGVAELASAPRAEYRAEPQAEVLPETTRQFLRPLIGLDPATVKVFRSEAASRLTAAAGADALTVDEHVLLADGEPIDGPRGVALLAHELTHVARSREPRFVPPVVLRGGSPSPADNDNDDEAVAGRVERAVRRAAKASIEGASPIDASSASLESSVPAAEHTAWGGLPAPWEPLPSWLTSPSPSPEATPTSGPATTVTAVQGQPAAQNTSDASGPQVYAAEHGRELQADDAGESVTSEPQPHHEERAVEPDLDALARQVYTLLKRRLASEQRRFG